MCMCVYMCLCIYALVSVYLFCDLCVGFIIMRAAKRAINGVFLLCVACF